MIDPASEFDFEIRNTSNSPNSYIATMQISEKLTYLKGHFPGQPILPAIAIIDASLETLKAAFGVKAQLVKVKSSKFLAPIIPGTHVSITAEQQDPYRWIIKWYIDEKIVSELDMDIATDLELGC